ncbi:MAG: NADH-quinone oxidoreductase subunit [Frankiaceae bacterium]|jgi:NADH-quinone oxidoreductase subunit L|nr:NADH-quinone oxidoreductase subunit [Frankiaceae bacterium]
MTDVAWLLPALPALAALVGLFAGTRTPGGPAVPAIAGSVGAFVVALLVLAAAEGSPGRVHESAVTWAPIGGRTLHVGTRVDGLVAVVAVMVCVVALLVQVYSTAYMAGDPRYSTYAAEVSLFTAAMLLVVVASNLFELLVGWELMGLCSYLLIGHYWQTEGARAAAVKAFVTTRFGDAAFLVGILVLGVHTGSFDIGRVLAVAHHDNVVTVGVLLLLGGVVGKSAQFPLHVWLPDAMAGPTPISALIHAATMVAAGIFVVARLYPLFLAAPVALTVLGVIACITMLGAALVALAEDDLKRVLAWSTVSQLAYMAGGLAVRGWTAGVYHLLTHAAFKALLFLAAGSVLRTVGTNLMSQMGGLRRSMPVTFATAVVGAAALAGLPPFAGAFSKDGVLDAAHERGGALGTAVYVVGLATVAVTAAYVTRLVVRTFLGDYRGTGDEARPRLHESPLVMTAPLVVLAAAAVLLGLPVLPHSYGVARWLAAPAGTAALHVGVGGVALSTALVVLAAATVYVLWRRDPAADPLAVLGPVRRPLAAAFGVDAFYDRVVVRPLHALAALVLRVDDGGIDATVEGSGATASGLGAALRRVQNGNVQAYASGLVLAVVALVIGVSLAVAR